MAIRNTPKRPLTQRPQSGVTTTRNDAGKSVSADNATSVARAVEPNSAPPATSQAVDLAHRAEVAQKLGETKGTQDADAAGAKQAFAGLGQNVGGGGGAGLMRFALQTAELRPGAKGPPSSAVQAFMADYGIDNRLGRPRERLLERMAEVHTQFASLSDADAVATHLEAGLVRFSVFKLEGALKLYRKEYGDPIEGEYDAVKALEDKAGEVARFSDRVKLAKEAGLPDAAIAVLQSSLDAARVDVRAEIKGNWSPDENGQLPALATMAETLGNLDWDGYKGDRKTVLKELKRRAKKATKEFDIDQLQGEEGLHELRRQLRWALLYCGAVDGLVKLDPKDHPIPEFAGLLEDPIASTKYAVLPSSAHEDDPLEVSQSIFLALNRYVIDIGDIKDLRERVEDFAHALQGSGTCATLKEAEAMAESYVFAKPGDAEAVGDKIEHILGELAKHEPLEAFLDAF